MFIKNVFHGSWELGTIWTHNQTSKFIPMFASFSVFLSVCFLSFLCGFFIEAGANNAETDSDSLHFELNRGWTVGWGEICLL